MNWLEDERVTQYLSDSRDVSHLIAHAIDRTQMPILTHLFNQGGRFFMAYDQNDVPVGFVRLVKTGADCEIVLVIGDHDNWGRRLGTSAIREGLKLAFLDMRAESVIAKIHPQNERSLKGFERCGFLNKTEAPTLNSLVMTSGRYLELLREGAMGGSGNIYITGADLERLWSLIACEHEAATFELEHEIERAIIVDPQNVAREVVTMNSRAVLDLDGAQEEVVLVYPHDADECSGKYSVLSEVGSAILGYQAGEAVVSMISGRTQQILIEKVTYQPECSGDFHL